MYFCTFASLTIWRPNHCSWFIETKWLSSIYRDQITAFDLSRPNHCPQFIETKSLVLSSIYRDQIIFPDLSRPNHRPWFIEDRMIVLNNMIIFNLSKPEVYPGLSREFAEPGANLEECHYITFKQDKNLPSARTVLQSNTNTSNGALNTLNAPQSYSILCYLSNWATLGGWRPMASPPPLPHTLSSPECILD